MADVFQFRMERMTKDLDDLEHHGLFICSKIAAIVYRRRDFEFHLKHPSPLKQDYLAYIDYERHLHDLHNLCKKKKIHDDVLEKDENRKKWRKSISDVAGVMRIQDIYAMAVMRYKGDLKLWFQNLELCREKPHGRIKKVIYCVALLGEVLARLNGGTGPKVSCVITDGLMSIAQRVAEEMVLSQP